MQIVYIRDDRRSVARPNDDDDDDQKDDHV